MTATPSILATRILSRPGSRMFCCALLYLVRTAYNHGGLWRWQSLTTWAFLLIVLYFAFASWASWSVYFSPGAVSHVAPSFAANMAVLLLGVSSTYAMMVTTIVTFVLIPLKAKRARKQKVDLFYGFFPLIMHNANLVLMVAELMLSGMHVDARHLPFAILFGATYACWHQIVRWRLTHTLLYFFLSWKHPHAIKISLGLLASSGVYFGLAWCITEVLRPKPWGAPLVIALTVAVMRLRSPQQHLSAAGRLAEAAPAADI